MSDTFTPNFRLTRVEFNTRNWQDKVNDNFATLDAITGNFLPLSGLKGVWTNNLPILANDILVDVDFGTLWKALVPHTTPATGTFLQDRLANPARWMVYATAATARGAWAGPGTNYNVNDFVVVSGVSQRYAIALTTHTSGASFDADLALGRWAVLIDVSLTGLGLGTMSTQDANNVSISGGVITGIDLTTVPVAAADILDHILIAEASNSDILARIPMFSIQTYTPTLFNITNVDTSNVVDIWRFIRIADMVIVFGTIEIDATAAANAEVQATLPVPSNFTSGEQVVGIAGNRLVADGVLCIVGADTTTDRARFLLNPSFTTNVGYKFIFIYHIV